MSLENHMVVGETIVRVRCVDCGAVFEGHVSEVIG